MLFNGDDLCGAEDARLAGEVLPDFWWLRPAPAEKRPVGPSRKQGIEDVSRLWPRLREPLHRVSGPVIGVAALKHRMDCAELDDLVAGRLGSMGMVTVSVLGGAGC